MLVKCDRAIMLCITSDLCTNRLDFTDNIKSIYAKVIRVVNPPPPPPPPPLTHITCVALLSISQI